MRIELKLMAQRWHMSIGALSKTPPAKGCRTSVSELELQSSCVRVGHSSMEHQCAMTRGLAGTESANNAYSQRQHHPVLFSRPPKEK